MFILKKEKLKTIALVIAIIIIWLLIIYIFILKYLKTDDDYAKLGLDIKAYDIKYYTILEDDIFEKYKVYKISNRSIEKLKKQLENSKLWSKNKYYEYVMDEFYDLKEGDETISIDRHDIYYYENGYAIFDVKNAKLYYLESNPYKQHKDYNEILGVKTNNYEAREIYSVRGGLQNDGTDYYTYQFTKEQGKEIINTLEKSPKWNKNRLEDNKLDDFEHNKEVLSIENGYYHYEKVCRASDENQKHNFTDEEATGWEIGVYDIDKNILYYYWTSY